ncbi:hypothetical protein [Candidatus Methanomassiliicoccus intestinalis]|uniref:hypothetical protein n=1 Tax=Candidatus Methanomassiliicoccus intestinalis TaxID=1406512 RepID=UPI0037DD74C9
MTERKRCLWMADDHRCANCKARRIRLDVLKIRDYDFCHPETDYAECEFYVEKPLPPK